MELDRTRYTPPELPTVVSRKRLMDRLRADPDRHLVLVTGQAAQGKSTLVADYLSTQDAPVAWLHLHSRDSYSDNFYHLLVSALSHAMTKKILNAYEEQACIAMGTSDARVRYEALLESIWHRLPDNIHIVLDGLEQIAPDAPSFGLIQRVIDLVDAKGRTFVLSRQMPPLKIQHPYMQRRLLVLSNDELAFTRAEIRAYFKAVHALTLTPASAINIENTTGGWAGGLVLISQALERLPGESWDRFLSSRLPISLAGDAWHYFATEIFDALPEKVKDLMIKASLLDVIDPTLLSELVNGRHITRVLDDLVRRNLFIQVVFDRHQRPLYRLNHLFRQFLQNRFQSNAGIDEQRRIYGQIALLYKERRQAEIAVDYYLKAQHHKAAAACIKKAGIDLVIRGRFGDLEKAVSGLPEHEIQNDPWLLFLLTLTRRVKGGVRNIKDFTRVLSTFKSQGDLRGQMLATAYLIEAQVFAGHDPESCRSCIAAAENMLNAGSEMSYYSYARALLWLQTGFAYIATGLNMAKGVSACQNAYLLAYRINNPRLMTNANIVAVLGLTLRGDFQRADEALDKIEAHADTDAYTEYHTLRKMVNAELALHRGDLDSAKKHLGCVAKEIESFGLLFLYPAYLDTMGVLQIHRKKYENARDTSRHLLDAATMSGNQFYEGISHRLNALRHYFTGNFFDAAEAVKNALALLPGKKEPTLQWMRTQQLAGMIQLHLKKIEKAEKRLTQAHGYYLKTANHLSLCETHLSMALLADRQKTREKTTHHLQMGFALAAEHQYDHFVVLSPDDLKKCCRMATAVLDRHAGAWPEHLLFSLFPKTGPDAAVESEPDADPAPDNKVDDLKKQPQDRKTPFLEIRTLGEFMVLRNGETPIRGKQWGGNQTKLLLKSILVHGMKRIPKEILIEDLWPESNPGSAIQNFKVTLHRLRKCLEPELKKHEKSTFIHLKDNLVSMDTLRCRIDVKLFLECCKDIKRAALAKETRAILELGQKVMGLYRGDFLPDDPYASWAEMKRMALKDEYLFTLMTMTGIYTDQHQFDAAIQCCRSAIAADPCLEQANGKLMQLYIRQGRRNDAVKLYKTLKTNLSKDLGVEPDPAITGLYDEIRRNPGSNR